ncbi:hypothetical protein A3A64_01630 [Candidatus Gottesmanbacteria bacterium RIFCSPLOWO2_01_FULL_48_11]|uniref:50S ribosomal protein L22 n=3 Tax=Candidatus Gottesmaniibacteriota TaxID=1752720 RepID=A0A0G1XNI7_9BACT|nr:MAG: 50S ribosomal protein L22 [Candidatus Gottesmanbacteria bacterium GW2011_GWA2_47_9]KKU95900.1 MAG: 50S ribosomal protein L22 [Candidatus Gottesmanbacteria bacterium GW2011_GWA1_48_13]OGG26597.1 MAG: hypothetical protein A3A64_01630 [Candidatus Gottesmanbacteria bacterium RIFCSPLOWO2_01_FULL_48_11]
MEYSATAKYVRVAPRKLRLVADSIRRLTPARALLQLSQVTKRGGIPLSAVIESAIANAKQKNVSTDLLRFRMIEVMGGPVMKRWHAVSKGTAHAYKKRMTHIRIVLTDDEVKK